MAKRRLQPLLPGVEIRIIPIRSEADSRPEEPLRQFGDKGAFVARIEEALIDGRADVAVHSLKDVPTEIPRGLWLPAYLPREDPRDVLISRNGKALGDLEPGSRVGTGSLRRVEQLKLARPDLDFIDIRGNIDTRLKKAESGGYEAIVLAAAGLSRLGLQDRVAEYLDPSVCLPAPGQGIIAVECRENYEFGEELIAATDQDAATCAQAERTLARLVGATCTTAFAALASTTAGCLSLEGWLHSRNGGRRVRVEGTPAQAARVASEAARELLVSPEAG